MHSYLNNLNMKKVIKGLILLLFTFPFIWLSCVDNKKDDMFTSNIQKTPSTQNCIVDSLTVKFLKNSTYKKAVEICSFTIGDKEFALNGIKPFGLRANLGNIFSEEELASGLILKEVTWEGKDGDYITVWYKQEKMNWQPIDIYKYGKRVRF